MEVNWDDLRLLLAVSRARSLTQAARDLKVDQTTVTRRMRALEERQGVKLFNALRGGISLTGFGEEFARTASELEDRVHDLDRRITGRDLELAGPVRFTLPVMLAHAWVMPLAKFAAAHPAVRLELVVDDQVRSLTRREADLALRFAKAPADHLVGRKVATLAVAVYGSPAHASTPVTQLPWVGWEPTDVDTSLELARRTHSPDGEIPLYVNSMAVLLEAARNGVGAVLLPCISGDADPSLVRLTEPEVSDTPLWLLTHPDLRESPRIRALYDYVADFVSRSRDALLGRDGTSPTLDGE